MRLDKMLSNLKYGSRKVVGKLIKDGFVSVNEAITRNPKKSIDPMNDTVMVNGEPVYYKDSILLMMNKPSGYICSNQDEIYPSVLNLIHEPYNRFNLNIAGRLDVDTEGLLLLTNDGSILHSIISPKKCLYKKYFVRVKSDFTSPEILEGDYMIKDGKGELYKPKTCYTEKLNDREFYLYIAEGKFHQVKRMVAHFDNEVEYLKREEVGDYKLDPELKLGEYKEL